MDYTPIPVIESALAGTVIIFLVVMIITSLLQRKRAMEDIMCIAGLSPGLAFTPQELRARIIQVRPIHMGTVEDALYTLRCKDLAWPTGDDFFTETAPWEFRFGQERG
ncbi:MAG: hypothetical protein JWL88_60 [Parcubacteria group bacterium]|nr:hypothetical protein [Parcubacteria group bacterium]